MSRVSVITDSNVCLPTELLECYNIKILPLLVAFGQEVLRDGIDITSSEFYARLETADPFPTTSSPNPGQFIEAFEEAKASGAVGVAVITLSSHLSMMFQSAHVARESTEVLPVEIIDSGLATMAQGFVVLEAARVAEQGGDLADVARAARSSRERAGFAFILDTLTYLHRGGRVPAIASAIGSALSIHPIVGDKGKGTVGILSPALGKGRLIESLVRAFEGRIADNKLQGFAVMHAEAPKRAQRLMDALASRFECGERYFAEFSAVMGVHAGPGAFGFAYLLAESEEINP